MICFSCEQEISYNEEFLYSNEIRKVLHIDCLNVEFVVSKYCENCGEFSSKISGDQCNKCNIWCCSNCNHYCECSNFVTCRTCNIKFGSLCKDCENL